MRSQHKILLIIGNGFDLDLKLSTGYDKFIQSDYFQKHLEESKRNKKGDLEQHDKNIFNYIQLQNGIYGWVDLEEALSQYANKGHVVYYDKDGKSNSISNASDDTIRNSYDCLCQELKNFLYNIDYQNIDRSALALTVYELVAQHKCNSIVTFNYTLLDRLDEYINHKCDNIRIDYIHGNIENEGIILGFQRNENVAPGYEYMIKTRNPQYKSCNLSKRMIEADEVIIFGHSLGSTDDYYFREYFNYAWRHNEKKSLTIFTKNTQSRYKIVDRMASLTDRHYEELLEKVNLNIFETSTKDKRIEPYLIMDPYF